MSLTSVQLLSERVAPQPLTPHQGERQREKGRLRERKRRETEGIQKREDEGISEISGGNKECEEEGGFVKDNRGDIEKERLRDGHAYTLNSHALI